MSSRACHSHAQYTRRIARGHSLLRSGEKQRFTDAIEERRTRVDVKLAVLAVDAQRDRDRALDVRPSAISAEALSTLVPLPCAGTDAPMTTRLRYFLCSEEIPAGRI